MFNAALRAAVEHQAWSTADAADAAHDAGTSEAEQAKAMRSALVVAGEGVR
ncbi:hypothetical protein SUDANB105_06993 [Streptomyces sp. enrichment culture]